MVPEDFLGSRTPRFTANVNDIANRSETEDELRAAADYWLTDGARDQLESQARTTAQAYGYRVLSSASNVGSNVGSIDAVQRAMAALPFAQARPPWLGEYDESIETFMVLAIAADYVADDGYIDPAVEAAIASS